MAQQYGGKYSPGATKTAPARPQQRRRRAGARVNFLFLLPGLFLLSAFTQEPVGMALDLAGFGALILAAWLTREGLIAEEAFEERRVAKRPAIPRKIFGSVLTGLGLAIAGLNPETFSPLNPAIFAVLGTTLHFFAFGPDPLKDKGVAEGSSFQTDRVARAVDEAEKHLAAMRNAIHGAGAPDLTKRVDGFIDTARQMFRVVEDDPRDLTGARKYLGVYLLGARDATTQFVDIYSRNKNAQAREKYEALLDDLESSFAARTEKMLLDDQSSLDVEIDVLRDRLAREGIKRS